MLSLADRQAADLEVVVSLAQRDLRTLWRSWDVTDAAATQQAMSEALAGLADYYQPIAGDVALTYYGDARAAAGVRGRYSARLVLPAPAAQLDAMARWSARPLFGAVDEASAAARLEGSLQRVVANAARGSIIATSKRDPAKARWYRSARGNACAFCAMTAARGAIYRSEQTANFKSHDYCGCVAAVEWRGGQRELSPDEEQFVADYEAARTAAQEAGLPVTADSILPLMRSLGRK